LTPEDRERYAKLTENGVLLTREQPVSTFSIDVDTGGYYEGKTPGSAGETVEV
jgi:hypothetical protein